MSRSSQLIAASLAAMIATGCTDGRSRDTVAQQPAPVAAPEAAERMGDVVVTGAQVSGRFALMAPPPPPPAPIVASPDISGPAYRETGRDRFSAIRENPFQRVAEAPVSTFSLDVDTASYSFVRASLGRNVLPPPDAVRTEEMVNYFPYDYAPARSAAEPFSADVAAFPSPWAQGRLIVRIGVRGYEQPRASRPRSNLVFLVDTSGSMNEPSKLPLVKQSLGLFLDQLGAEDRVAIVAYAGSAGTVLEPTPASDRTRILAALDRLGARGSTAGGEGIRLAYALAQQNFDRKAVNRVMLATDGDFNVGISDPEELKGFVERERGKGVYLSVLGFGMGNYNDVLMQALAQNGNGVAAYIDNLNEARKVLVEEATSSLIPIADDAKVQVEFNPAAVAEYRLIGYETRLLNREDFNNDKVDAGDVGSGRTVTALYELVPLGGPQTSDPSRYARNTAHSDAAAELGFVKIRYKRPGSSVSKLIAAPIRRTAVTRRFEDAPTDARFAVAVAGFAELLRGGKQTGAFAYDDVVRVAEASKGQDRFGYRSEFIQLVRAAKSARSMAVLER